MSQLLGTDPDRVRPVVAEPRRASGTSRLNLSQSNSLDRLDSSLEPRRRPRPAAAERRSALVAVVGVIALGLVGLGVRAVPEMLGATGAISLLAAPASAAPTAPAPAPSSIAPAETVPTPTPTSSPTSTPSARRPSPKKSESTKPVKVAEVPATGPGRYQYAHTSVAAASTTGTLIKYDVRVEDNLDLDPDQTATFIAEVLNDKRSWRGSGRWRFQLVSSANEATLHAYIVTPGTTDALCAPLLTQGEVSCQNGNRVVLNAKRWFLGADSYGSDLLNYRRYVVNHEFGHSIGHGHVQCPGKGRPAPVMMQQTKGLGGCRKNPWPQGTDS